ncbi:hypothetical protein EDD21DRAFT_33781 [Dissophora ornata]|nr:hypothetical protein EDD21DRAFT_33781 [Dissophora ornata]
MGRMVIFPTPNPLPPLPPSSPPLPPLPLSYSYIAPFLPLPLSCASSLSLSLSLPSPPPLPTTATAATATTTSIASSSSFSPPPAPAHTPSPQVRSIFHSCIADSTHSESPPSPPPLLYTHAEEHYRPRLSNQTRRSLQELARQQFYHSHRQSNNNQTQYRLETLCTTSRQRRQPPSWSESARGRQRKHTHSYPVYASQGPVDTRIAPPKPRRIPSAESLNFLSRILCRLSRFNCVCGTSPYSSSKQHFYSRSSIYLPRVSTVNSVSLSATSTSSTSVRHSQQHPGAKRKRHRTARSSRSVTASRGGIGTRVDKGKGVVRRDNGKQRASFGSGLRSGSLAEKARGRAHSRRLSSLSLSTIHSWCPYCIKTIPNDQSDHHQVHHQHSLISPSPTPHRTHSSRSRSRSSSPSQSLTQPCSNGTNPSAVSIYTTQSLAQTASASSFISDLDLVSTGFIPDILFTFNHPSPHLKVISALASTPFSAALNTVAEGQVGIAAEAKSKETEESSLSVTPPIHNRFQKGVETSPWLSFPSADGGDTKIRSFTGLSRSSTARGDKGAAAATENTSVPNKRKSWSIFSFRNRRSSLPAQPSPSVHQDQDRSALVKSQTSLVIEPQRQNPLWDSQKTQPRETTHNYLQYQQHRETVPKSTSKVGSTPVPDSKMRILSTQEQAALSVGNSSRSQSFSPGIIMDRASATGAAVSTKKKTPATEIIYTRIPNDFEPGQVCEREPHITNFISEPDKLTKVSALAFGFCTQASRS